MTTESVTMPTTRKLQFELLIQQHRKIIFKVANTYCWQAEDRADLAQEIAAQLWRSFAAYDEQRNFSTWMYRIALNVAISNIRQQKNQQHVIPMYEKHLDISHEDQHMDQEDERIKLLKHFIEKLDALNRALMLLYLEDHSYREIADVLGISESNVATKISRLKQKIRDDMTNQS
jgi:RNA polymerase sigma factor (sigma-70 family)